MEGFKYSVDDSSSETSLLGNSTLGPRDVLWLNQFNAAPEADTITGISLAWGSPNQPAFTIDGDPIVVALYEDPNDDGNPDDAVLLTTAEAQVVNPNTDQFATISIDPTVVSDSFFVGALLPNQPSTLGNGGPAAVDTTSPQENRSFVATAGNGAFNLNNLAANSELQPLTGGNWLLRAEAEADPSVFEITVDTTLDELDGDITNIFSLQANPGGTGISLREALIAAQTNAATINLEGGEIYDLSIDGEGEDTDLESLLNIGTGQNITIRSEGNEKAEINGNGLDRVFTVSNNAELNLQNITVTGGQTTFGGGGIANLGTLSLTDSLITDNSANRGGGLFNTASGKATLTNSVISLNNAVTDGGGIFNNSEISLIDAETLGEITLDQSTVSENIAGGSGGGIASFIGRTILTDSTVAENTAAVDGGGIIAQGADSTFDSAREFILTDSQITNNRSGQDGGGLYVTSNVSPDDRVTLTNTSISTNTAERDGGGIYNASDTVIVDNGVVRGNEAINSGGGIFASGIGAQTVLSSSLVSENTAAVDGGGIFSNASSDVFVLESTVDNNEATRNGGGINNDGLTTNIVNSTVSNNQSGVNGGGVFTESGAATNLPNSTVSGNTANNDGGGIFNQPTRGSVDPFGNVVVGVPGGTTNLFNTTVTQNTADVDDNGTGNGGGIANRRFRDGNVIFLPSNVDSQNSIIAGNRDSQDNDGPGDIQADIAGSVDGNNNLVSSLEGAEGSITEGNNILSPNPRLGQLQDNGGATLTHALLNNSPAIDAGDNALIPADINDQNGNGDTTEQTPFDQRGSDFARIVRDTVDIGAFEASLTPPPVEEPQPTDPSTPPVEEPQPTDPTAPPVEEPQPTDPTVPPAEEPQPTDPSTPPVEEPQPTDPTAPPVEEPQPTDPTMPPAEEPQPTDPSTPPVDGPQPTDPSTPPVDGPQPTDPTTPPVDGPQPTDPTTPPPVDEPQPTDPTAPPIDGPQPTDPSTPPSPGNPAPIPATLSVTPTAGTESEGTEFTITVTAESAVTGDQTIDLTLTGGTDSADFTGVFPSQITIPDGQTIGTTTVMVNDDMEVEADIETATFEISNPSDGLILGDNNRVDVTIEDNDEGAVSEPDAPVVFNVEINIGTLINLLVFNTTSAGSGSNIISNLVDSVLALGQAAAVENLMGSDLMVTLSNGIELEEESGGSLQSEDPVETSVATNGDDSLIGTRNRDRIDGLEGNDQIRGLGESDILVGGPGNDTLTGSAGNDTLTGGIGLDVFALAPEAGTDVFTDFEIGVDVIGLSDGLCFSGLSFSGNEISFEDQILAMLTGVDTTTLTADSFTAL
ncbi:choice-of-anchor Q domain-containing protein [Acaryochloris sp. IP29b_bin.148]|uniref:choice-of-anchor Q domain-containing protein n=1 Tax=Acaryochloris sp. IP29b_bin.148 TaxID=2969218 RepID=UPI002623F472|nr:choice-of-anchor Q domain-containing protein [Acaryochloris sp. IP29b_bin.148]